MPIKEIIVLSTVVMAAIMLSHPTRPIAAIREVQIKILREVGRTDNWGNPSIFRSEFYKNKKVSRIDIR